MLPEIFATLAPEVQAAHLATLSPEAQAELLAAASAHVTAGIPAPAPAVTPVPPAPKTGSLFSQLAPASASTSASTSTVESSEVIIQTLSAPIAGKYGSFRQFSIGGTTFNIDDSRLQNSQVFRPNCKATITIQQYTNKDGILKTIIAGLNIHLPDASGLFIMR
jgi:hypothetical protein